MSPDTSQREQIWHISSSRLEVWVQSEISVNEMKLKHPWLTIAIDNHGNIGATCLRLEAPDSTTIGNLISSICSFVDNEEGNHWPIELWIENGKSLQGVVSRRANDIQIAESTPGYQWRHDKVEQIFQELNANSPPGLLTLEDLRMMLDSFSGWHNADLELPNTDDE